jgi:hypothetical protein
VGFGGAFSFNKFKLVARHSSGLSDRPRGQFQHGMRSEAKSHSAAAHILSYFENLPLLTQEQHIDRELHAERMDGFARHNPHALTRLQTRMLQQPGAPLAACVSDFYSVAK